MEDERASEPIVERVERTDGRYVLYFSWAEEPPVGESPDDPAGAGDE